MRLGVKKEHLLHSNVMTFSLPAPKWGSLAPANVEAHLPLTCVRPGTRPQCTFGVCVWLLTQTLIMQGFVLWTLCIQGSSLCDFGFGPGARDGEQVEDTRAWCSSLCCSKTTLFSNRLPQGWPLAWPLWLLDPPSTLSCSPLSLTFYILGDEGVMRLIFSPTAHQTEPQMHLILQWTPVSGLRSGTSTKVMTAIFFLVF